jgi:hypothetical protein
MTKPKLEPKRIFDLVVYVQGSETRNIESAVIERALRLGLQSFRSRVGLALEDKIIDDGGVIVGRWHYEPGDAAA